MIFEKKLFVGWGDIDFNAHMKNTAFLDKCGDVRMLYLAANGFQMRDLLQLKIGPVVMKDEIEYFKELRILDEFRVTYQIAGMSADGSRYKIRNEFFRADNKLAAKVTCLGGWLDLTQRKLTIPPEALRVLMQNLVKTEDYQDLPSSIK